MRISCRIYVALMLLLSYVLAQLKHLSRQDFLPKFDIVIVGTNDIHGTAYPTILSRKDTRQKYAYGGLVYMASIIQILKQQSHGNVLYLDAGDQFQGGLQASKIISSGQIISDYFNHMNVDASAVGNHQFDFGPEFLDTYISKLKNDVLSANFIDQSNNKLPLPKQQKSKIYKFPIKNRSHLIDQDLTEIKIGVIGLSTVETPHKSTGFVNGLFPESFRFQNYKKQVLEQAALLQAQGAHSLILISHVGNACNNNSDYGLWTVHNQQRNIPCEKDDEMFRLLDQLPPGLIDAVVQGHRHTQSHYFYRGIPIIGSINGGYYLNTIRLRFTLDKKSVTLNVDDLLIEGPIPVCERIFQNTKKCQYVKPQNLQKAGDLIQWNFHGQKVTADVQLAKIYQQKYSQKMKKYEYQICNNYIPNPMFKDYEANSSIGNLITNVMANSILRRSDLKFDFLILNGGGFRTTWYPGVIRYGQLHSMFPFDNTITSFKISGSDLKKLLQIIQNGQKRYYPTWGLQQRFLKNPSNFLEFQKIRHKHLLSQQQLKQSQQYYHLQSLVSTLTGQPIEDTQIYTGVSMDFLLNGGDDFIQIINRPTEIRIMQKTPYSLLMKDLIQAQLQHLKDINQKDLIGPNAMERIVFLTQQQKRL